MSAGRRLAVLATLAVLVVVPGATTSETPADPLPRAPYPAVSQRIPYGPEPDTFGDLYLPEGTVGRLPVVVMIHGGGWAQNRTLTHFAPISHSLAEAGVAVWSIEYRRVHGAGGWPVTLADVAAAVAALATVVQARAGHRLDLRRVHLAGHSAGGHLAAWVAGRHTLPAEAPGVRPGFRPRSAILMAGVLDLELAATHGRDAFVRDLLGGLPDQVPERYRTASPIRQLPVGVRLLAVHGDADRVVPLDQSRRYVDTAIARGDNARLLVLPGVGHAEFVDVASAAWARTRQTILEQVDADR
ncbi:alpha/beta fold hydrolase [Nocardia sp. NPDC050435]|uniref:alpha/beta hydrolase family protein n=1 Tax=Nocardia sp. NPDC050435 TaxID=3155040 RepID=UPI0033E7F68C